MEAWERFFRKRYMDLVDRAVSRGEKAIEDFRAEIDLVNSKKYMQVFNDMVYECKSGRKSPPVEEIRPGLFYRGQKMDHFECQDCKKQFPVIFMLKRELWDSLGITGIICPECVEVRLGRLLTIEDMGDVLPTNDQIFYGYKLGRRG